MSTATQQIMTAQEFFQWVLLPANQGRRFELVHGKVVELPPAGKYHGFVCGNVAGILGNFAAAQSEGYVCTNAAGVVVGRGPDSVRGPDVTYYVDDETADNMQRKYAQRPPVLAVEVVSPTDRINDIMLRVTQLLAQGVGAVWVVDPEARDISICRAGKEPQLVQADEHIAGGTELPEFRCSVAEFFATPAGT